MVKRYAQIFYGKAHWIFESETKPIFAPNIILVDVTNKSEIQEGWVYNSETNEFTAPVNPEPAPIEPQPTLEEMQTQALLNTEYLVAMSELTTL